MKSPGKDGFTTVFYIFIWLDVKQIIAKSFIESDSPQTIYISQRQGIITCIPNEGKYKYSLQNWRPITLLETY